MNKCLCLESRGSELKVHVDRGGTCSEGPGVLLKARSPSFPLLQQPQQEAGGVLPEHPQDAEHVLLLLWLPPAFPTRTCVDAPESKAPVVIGVPTLELHLWARRRKITITTSRACHLHPSGTSRPLPTAMRGTPGLPGAGQAAS